jgi:hypothetical protein
MSTHYFSCSGGPGANPTKSEQGHATSNLCFCIWLDLQVTCYVLLSLWHKTSMHYFSCWCEPGTDPTKSVLDTLLWTCVYTSDAIYRSHCAFWCIQGLKSRCIIFHARVGLVQIPQKVHWTHYSTVLFLHLVWFAGHKCQSVASGAWNVDIIFFMLR